MFHRRNNLAASNYYINLEKDQFLLACQRDEFHPGLIPNAFLEVQEGTYVLTMTRDADDLKVQEFKSAVNALRHKEDILDAYEKYQLKQEYRPKRY